MPEYWVIVNDPDTYPEYAYNERIIDAEVFTLYDNRPSREDALTMATVGYSRMRITTEFYEFMGPRKPASFYHGPLAGTLPPGARFENYVSAGIAAVLRSTQSRRDGSLPSKSKTRGNLKPSTKKFLSGYKPYAYKPKSGERCAPGYRWNQRDKMCVEL